jgi:hypothetical protein
MSGKFFSTEKRLRSEEIFPAFLTRPMIPLKSFFALETIFIVTVENEHRKHGRVGRSAFLRQPENTKIINKKTQKAGKDHSRWRKYFAFFEEMRMNMS